MEVEIKWKEIFIENCTEAVSAQHQVFADYSSNIIDTATAISW
jgi:hypothetical protein